MGGGNFDESEPRDQNGQWTSGGGGGATNQDTHARMDKLAADVHSKDAFSEAHLSKLRDEYSKINTVDPAQPSYQKITGTLDKMNQPQLKQLAGAKIKFLSSLARNRVK